MRAITTALALIAMATMAAAQEPVEGSTDNPTIIEGPALPLDGGTVLIDERRVRLFGIDAPEMSAWPFGPQARSALDDLVAAKTVRCVQRDTDESGRPVAICGTAESADIGSEMLRTGHATVFRVFTAGTDLEAAYDAAERSARADELGVWKGDNRTANIDGRPTEHRWLSAIDRFQGGIGALLGASVGLLAILIGALYNAKLARDRDDYIRDEEAKSLAAELVGEFEIARRELSSVASALIRSIPEKELDKTIIDELPDLAETSEHYSTPGFSIFIASYGQLGKLDAALVYQMAGFSRVVWDRWSRWTPQIGLGPTHAKSANASLKEVCTALKDVGWIVDQLCERAGIKTVNRDSPSRSAAPCAPS